MAQYIRLIHWNEEEAIAKSVKLEAAGFMVDIEPFGPASLRELRRKPPAAVVIDLNRLPSQGRDVGIAVRQHRATRDVPIVFVEGEPAKVARIKQLLPDAVYTRWGRISSSLKRAIANPPAEPVVHKSSLVGYSGTPLPKKLGIKSGYVVALVNAPKGFEETLGRLPEDVQLRRQARGKPDLVVWFTRSLKEMAGRVGRMGALAGQGGLWIAWPKKSSGVATDLSQTEVRRAGLAAGLVDYKVAAIDETWSGLRFARRKSG